jgi:hypothetical protein
VVVATGACSTPFFPPFARACFAQQHMQLQHQQQSNPIKRRLRSHGMSILHSHYFPWKQAQEFTGQVF